ncbi:UDP-glucosyltransferase 2-like [Diabrotica undecimpunctata]|uniref:UDP-glucosyltransferase 2-like n=1 Tax=Diabrotica undecimpunctata TaxID=50387 RepID=UPI003B6395B9
MQFKQFVSVLYFTLNSVFGANILFVSNIPSPSHQIWNYGLAEGLLKKGHNITMLAASPVENKSYKNYHPIDITGLVDELDSEMDFLSFFEMTIFKHFMVFVHYSLTSCNYILHSDALKTLLNYPKDYRFDLIIFDNTCGPCTLPLIQRFHYPPAVAVTALLLPQFISEIFGNNAAPAYIPYYSAEYVKETTFLQRLKTFYWIRAEDLVRKYYFNNVVEGMTKEIFGRQMDSLDSLENHISLLLCNLMQGFSNPQPLTPNIIPVGGLHIKPAKTLPEDLQRIMDNTKEGVILFSLGTNVKSSLLSEDKRKAILGALGKLKQTVLWKFEADLENIPKNVIIKKWFPQRDLLAHPNLKLFISHGGALSTAEAAYNGVPVVGIPFFADQYLNINIMESKEIAVRVDFVTMTATTLLDKFNEILHNPKYLQNAKKLSQIIKDQPQTPLERAVFWVEFAIRNNGTHILDPASRHMSYFITSSLDIYLFLASVIIVILWLLLKCLSLIKYCLCKNTKKLKDE